MDVIVYIIVENIADCCFHLVLIITVYPGSLESLMLSIMDSIYKIFRNYFEQISNEVNKLAH